MFRTQTRFGKITVGPFCERIRIAVRELALHGIVSSLVAFVRLERALSTVGIIVKMIAGTAGHNEDLELRSRADSLNRRLKIYAQSLLWATAFLLCEERNVDGRNARSSIVIAGSRGPVSYCNREDREILWSVNGVVNLT